MMRKRISTPEKGQRRFIGRLFVWILGLLENAAIVGVTLLLVWAFESRNMPALDIWHTTPLAGEFTSGDANPESTLQDYLEQEERLFEELRLKIYDQVPRTAAHAFSRYRAGGPQDPSHLPHNWNRSFELVPETIRGGALLLHGLTDSPYSLRRIGEILYEKGFYVLGLRLPGHGTLPGALTEVNWEDWVAASRIAGRHVRQRVGPETPFLIAGYSNGGALAVKYSLDALSDPDLPPADRLILFSPEIGITPFSAIANTHKLFSFIPYFEQSKWLSIQPEYDPFKYNSFPKNAGQQGHEITTALQKQLAESRKTGKLSAFPPVITFLSWVDATVKTSMTIDRFYGQLENPGNELVIFDVNRSDEAVPFYPAGDAAVLDVLEETLRSSLSADVDHQCRTGFPLRRPTQQGAAINAFRYLAAWHGLASRYLLPVSRCRSIFSRRPGLRCRRRFKRRLQGGPHRQDGAAGRDPILDRAVEPVHAPAPQSVFLLY
jgi:alpha-beta hydrolase superfamily lysophospholipase